MKDSWLIPSLPPQPPLDLLELLCRAGGEGGAQNSSTTSCTKSPQSHRIPGRGKPSLGEENPPCRDANLVPAPRPGVDLLRTHLQMVQEKSPLSSLVPTFICHCCTGKIQS